MSGGDATKRLATAAAAAHERSRPHLLASRAFDLGQRKRQKSGRKAFHSSRGEFFGLSSRAGRALPRLSGAHRLAHASIDWIRSSERALKITGIETFSAPLEPPVAGRGRGDLLHERCEKRDAAAANLHEMEARLCCIHERREAAIIRVTTFPFLLFACERRQSIITLLLLLRRRLLGLSTSARLAGLTKNRKAPATNGNICKSHGFHSSRLERNVIEVSQVSDLAARRSRGHLLSFNFHTGGKEAAN